VLTFFALFRPATVDERQERQPSEGERTSAERG
jgi:hypothetical protein